MKRNGAGSRPKALETRAARSSRSQGVPIVGVGASSGGLEAFTTLLAALPPDTGMGYVLVQHLDPGHESALTELLGRATTLPVHEVTNNLRVEPDHIYVIPPNTLMTIARGVLKLAPRRQGRGAARSIDHFLESLAQDQRERAIGVILSGNASDGTLGLEAIKAEGGITFAQDVSARHDSMPRSAIAAGCVDLVRSPEAIAHELGRIAKHPAVVALPAADSGYRSILQQLRQHSGVDFADYKSTTMQRRIARRMVLHKQNTIDEYSEFIRGNGEELDALFADSLISVTGFFRNPAAFEVIQSKVLPKFLQAAPDEPLRMWVVGCSTGQEAYSLAMAWQEAADSAPRPRRLQVFATDLNGALLERARRGLYSRSVVADLSPERRQRFFVEEEDGYRIIKSLREMVVFARQNFITDPPFSRLDLISCRNVMIYLEPSLQQKLLSTFHRALKPGGFLFLGAAESTGSNGELFEPTDRKHKIYSRRSAPVASLQVLRGERPGHAAPVPGRASRADHALKSVGATTIVREPNAMREADRIMINRFAPPGVLIDGAYQVLQFRGQIGAYLEPPAGKASFDVLKMARNGLMLALRSAINDAKESLSPVCRDGVRFASDGGARTVNLEVIPLNALPERCFLILFHDAAMPAAAEKRITPRRRNTKAGRAAQDSPKGDAARIAELETELRETRDYLHALREQHEAANEALQSASEEVQSANEELQSFNEELETSKEELESTNEELTTLNEEMAARNVELNIAREYAEHIVETVHEPLLVLDANLRVQSANRAYYDLFESTPLATLHRYVHDLGRGEWNVAELRSLLHDMLSCEGHVDDYRIDQVFDRLGARSMLLNARCIPGANGQPPQVLLAIEDITPRVLAEESRSRLAGIVESTDAVIISEDLDGIIPSWNAAAQRLFGVDASEALGKSMAMLVPPGREQEEAGIRTRIRRNEAVDVAETVRQRSDGSVVDVSLAVSPITGTGGAVVGASRIIRDITESRRAQHALRESEERYRTLFDAAPMALCVCDHAGILQYYNQRAAELWGRKPVVTQEVPAGPLDPLMDVLRTGIPASGVEMTLERNDGSSVPVLANFAALRDATGQIVGAVTSFVDISDQKATEASLLDAAERKNEFLSVLAHELRGPLAPIQNALQIMERTRGDGAKNPPPVGMMQRQVTQMVRLVDDLLDVGRISRGKIDLRLASVDVNAAVQEAADASRWMTEAKDQTLTVTFSGPLFVRADATRLAQVVGNLLHNACKFTAKRGTIAVTVERADDSALIRVRDNGCGIAADQLDTIFGMFMQLDTSLDRSNSGLGIGLTLARDLAAMHGGSIEAHSDGPGQGSEFILQLPLDIHRPAVSSQAAEPETANIAGLRILVVDDNVDSADSLTMLLELMGGVTQVAHDGTEALRLAEATRPDLMLLDIGLPGLNGYEVCRLLRSHDWGRRMTTIALTGWGQSDDIQRSADAGFDGHLVKPLDLLALQRLLSALGVRGAA